MASIIQTKSERGAASSLGRTESQVCFGRAEVLQEIAEYAGNATNDGLKTVNEATTMNEGEIATRDALD